MQEPPRSGTPARVWGPPAWGALHRLAIGYPVAPTRADVRRALGGIARVLERLPCPSCRRHAAAYLGAHPPDLSNTYALQKWVWTFHNAVNLRKKGPAGFFPFEAYQALYADEMRLASIA